MISTGTLIRYYDQGLGLDIFGIILSSDLKNFAYKIRLFRMMGGYLDDSRTLYHSEWWIHARDINYVDEKI